MGCYYSVQCVYHISAKFLRRIIFAFFTYWSGTTKIRRHEILTVKGVANRISLIRENCFCETLQLTRSVKIVHLENLVLFSIIRTALLRATHSRKDVWRHCTCCVRCSHHLVSPVTGAVRSRSPPSSQSPPPSLLPHTSPGPCRVGSLSLSLSPDPPSLPHCRAAAVAGRVCGSVSGLLSHDHDQSSSDWADTGCLRLGCSEWVRSCQLCISLTPSHGTAAGCVCACDRRQGA